MRAWVSARMPSSKVLKVPSRSTVSGMMISRLPPWLEPIQITAGSFDRFNWRPTIVCKPMAICDVLTIGSMPVQRKPPCVCLPVSLIANVSED
jgi:hypothetical protein